MHLQKNSMAQELNYLRNSVIFNKTQSKNFQNSICRCFRELKNFTHILAEYQGIYLVAKQASLGYAKFHRIQNKI